MAQALKEFEVANYWLASPWCIDRTFFERMRLDAMSIIFFGD